MTSAKRDFDELHSRVFKGILLHEDIVRMEEAGVLTPPPERSPVRTLLGEFADYFSPELRGQSGKMTYVYSLFYCFENSVRDLVSQRLQERKGPDWWTSVPKAVQDRVEGRKKDAENNKWHRATVDNNIDFTLFGDLASTIIKEWQEFEELFPSQSWVKTRLDELERSRNVIAHGNVLPDEEIERIEQYLGDWLRQVP